MPNSDKVGAVRFPRITVDSKMPIPIPRPPHEVPKFFVHQVLLEYKTTNPQVTPIDVAKAMLSALDEVDDTWTDRTRIVEAYSTKRVEGVEQR